MADVMVDDDDKPYTGPLKKHRHDLGHEDHGAKLAAGTTRAIQGLLGLWIALSLGFVVYAMVDAVRSRGPVSAPGPQGGSAAPVAPASK